MDSDSGPACIIYNYSHNNANHLAYYILYVMLGVETKLRLIFAVQLTTKVWAILFSTPKYQKRTVLATVYYHYKYTLAVTHTYLKHFSFQVLSL